MSEPIAPTIAGAQVWLRPLCEDDVGPAYVAWMNDPLVVRYLESRFRAHSLEGLREWLRATNASPSEKQFGIFLRDAPSAHVGNIKLGGIDRQHRRADIGLLVGERAAWGRGIATEAISLVSRVAFEQLDLHKVTASCYAPNVGSARAFLKAGFFEEGRRRAHFLCEGQWVDSLQFARLNERISP